MDYIYLDHNASAPLDPEVWEAMRPYSLACANAESHHTLGRKVRQTWENARETVATILHADHSEVVFTSGGTEANNLALFGLAFQHRVPGSIITSPLEHPAVSKPLEVLETKGFTLLQAGVCRAGFLDLDQVTEVFRSDTQLATLILAHNEVGVIQPLRQLVEVAARRNVPVHTDAVQAVGRIPVDFHALGVATLAASAHKFHGPVGIGLLLVREGIDLIPYMVGGGQQRNRRPGTLPVALAVGLARALEKSYLESESRINHWRLLRKEFEEGLIKALGPETVRINGPANVSCCLPQTLHVSFPGIDGNALLIQLDHCGIAASLGSACASGSNQPSPSLLAMHIPENCLRSSVRFSFGAFTTKAEIQEALKRVVPIINRFRET
jgi:cysteine desulfurase